MISVLFLFFDCHLNDFHKTPLKSGEYIDFLVFFIVGQTKLMFGTVLIIGL
ncbi:hypothetical protein VAE151_550557 [Vibrio aestuarianus]|uniref:Uncharacterized protein n=1 Tax=Vibrio aestuarianus TaxID=28171 RepID=A0ABM9FQI2_9VIBR|nr:hypothetical protein VAE308_1050562 [Vibrio aestuarianus]CAH8197849.1 hypothetical protein VIBAE_A31155 [Vibrio aestuarianus subsp. francensis]CAH8198245.1 hypothetical protein VAE055_370557 [Vibrio aestuarianus]CAH8198310.1 hypothetical protein VAE032_270558 [Vibrio aestuarianus]CAH8198469.1 hypothetical protein VAE128_460561 [Vibrio aestuarianus]